MTQSTDSELKYITDLLVELKSDIKETNNRFDKVDDRLEKIKDDVSTIKTDVAVLKANQDNIQEKISKIDGTQKAQLWSLIVAVFGIVGLLAVALFKMNSQ